MIIKYYKVIKFWKMIFKVIFHFFIFTLSIFKNHLEDDTSCRKRKLSKI